MSAPAGPIMSFVDEGLGHSSYLVDLGDGRALIIDPPRFPDRHLAVAADRRLEIAYTADTHSHADYVSGGPELAARGVEFLASKGAELLVPHRDVKPGDEITLTATLSLRAIPTPGHTPDHLAYLLVEHGQPIADLCYFAEGMRNEEYGLAGTALLCEDLLEQQSRVQVEPFHRLVKDEQIRLREHAVSQREALNHPLAKAGDRFTGVILTRVE